MKPMNRTLTRTVALALAVALALPAATYAAPGPGAPRAGVARASADATRAALAQQRLELLKQRIELVLANRKSRFDLVAERVTARIARLSTLADQVEKAGGDVSGVRASLEDARDIVAQARSAEAKAVSMFEAVPAATNKRAAFAAARAQGRIAARTLDNARLKLRNAVLNLRAITNGLKGAQR
jgi:TolA-binding protein